MTTLDSILFPQPTVVVDEHPLAPTCCADLHLDQVFAAVTAGRTDTGWADFYHVPLREVTVITYRHEVFRDLERTGPRGLVDRFVAGMRTVRQRLHRADKLFHPLQRHSWLLYAVESYCDSVTALCDESRNTELTSRGLRGFADHVQAYVGSGPFQRLIADTRAVQAGPRDLRYTVHIRGLRVDVEKYCGQSDYSSEVAATFERFATATSRDYHVRLPEFPDMNNVEEQILQGVATLFPAEFTRLETYCARNTDFLDPVIARFDQEVPFYLAFLDFTHRFDAAGLTFGYPSVTTEPGICQAEGAFDLALAVKAVDTGDPVVRNDFRLAGSERILVVTGPNQSGKTTFARAIGQCAYLASLGCPVPAADATLTLPDAVYTHFERQEILTTLHGKLDDELVRIHDILSRASATSVIVMNESFASTTAGDAVLIGAEVITRIVTLGGVAVYVSFLDELADFAPACVSMVGEVVSSDPSRRTFRFTRRPADGLAYAAALADKYRLDYARVLQRISR